MINQSLPTSSLQAFQMRDNKFQITDEDLILRFQSGDENAYSEIVSRYRDRLVNFIFRFMNDFDQAEDLAQDTLLKVYTHKHYYKNIAKFSTWIYTIASNLAKTELRKKKNRKTSSLSNMGLDDKEYDVLRMSYGLDCVKHSATEIANKIGINGSSSYVRVSQLKKQAVEKLIENVDHSQVPDYL